MATVTCVQIAPTPTDSKSPVHAGGGLSQLAANVRHSLHPGALQQLQQQQQQQQQHDSDQSSPGYPPPAPGDFHSRLQSLQTSEEVAPNFRPSNYDHNAADTGANSNGNRVPIPQLNHRRTSSQSTLASQQPLPVSMGPMSSEVLIPARPKPGRKPLPEADAQDRRRVQNRQAQRNFRDKRAQKVSELTQDNDRIRREKEQMASDYERRLEEKRQQCQKLQQKLAETQKSLDEALQRANEAESKFRNAEVEKRFREAGFPNPSVVRGTTGGAALPAMTTNWQGPVGAFNPKDNVMTPPDELETDMTNFWRRRNMNSNNARPGSSSSDAPQLFDTSMDIDADGSKCGFCTDDTNCSCLQSKVQVQKIEQAPTPGSCDACRRDPARAEACRSLAAKTSFSARPSASQATRMFEGNNEGARNDSMAPPPPTRMMSCSTLIDRIGESGQRVPSINELFGGILHSYPATSGAGAGYDVNEQEAAQVLQNMSRRNTLVSPTQP